MDWLSIALLVIKYAPQVKSIWDESVSNTDLLHKVSTLPKEIGDALQTIGGALFPQAAPQLHVLGGLVAAVNPDLTKWLQGSLNVLYEGTITLTVDGIYGPKTAAAVKQFQTDHHLAVDGIAGLVTQSAIQAVLSAKPKLLS